jgi:CelD/BcsL family acetyltransferase involved in cellulose biosynthesis
VPVERHDRIESVAAGWDELADRVGASVWLRPGWISAWVDAFVGAAPLEVFVERRAGRLAGVLPMLRGRDAFSSPTNWHTPEFGLLAEDAEAGSALAAALLADRPRKVTLGWVSPEGLEAVRSAAKELRYRVLERSLMRSPYLPLGVDGRSEASTEASPRSSTVRRHRRKLERTGEVRFDVETGTEHLPDGFRLEASGWKEKQGTAIVSQPETHRFYAAIAQWAADREMLRLFFLRLDERPIAFVLGVEDGSRLCYVKGGFDDAFRRFGPGVIITHEMIAYAKRQGLRSFEFLGGEDPWKLEWTSEVRDRRLFQAFAPAPAGFTEWALYAYGRPLAKRVVGRRRRSLTSSATASLALH